VRTLLGKIESWRMWVLCDRPPIKEWSRGRMTLLGDAAHAMLPHLGQGANQSIEDGIALATILQRADRASVPAAPASGSAAGSGAGAEPLRASTMPGRT